VPGWKEDLSRARSMSDLPEAARTYVAMIEQAAGCEAMIVSVGSRRDETIVRSHVFG
jgi:adenylosuccinate synthase